MGGGRRRRLARRLAEVSFRRRLTATLSARLAGIAILAAGLALVGLGTVGSPLTSGGHMKLADEPGGIGLIGTDGTQCTPQALLQVLVPDVDCGAPCPDEDDAVNVLQIGGIEVLELGQDEDACVVTTTQPGATTTVFKTVTTTKTGEDEDHTTTKTVTITTTITNEEEEVSTVTLPGTTVTTTVTSPTTTTTTATSVVTSVVTVAGSPVTSFITVTQTSTAPGATVTKTVTGDNAPVSNGGGNGDGGQTPAAIVKGAATSTPATGASGSDVEFGAGLGMIILGGLLAVGAGRFATRLRRYKKK